jgi:hypothetical protein
MRSALVWIALAALLANAQCYGICGGADCGFAHQSPAGGCHHRQSSPEKSAACTHQQAELTVHADGIACAFVAIAPSGTAAIFPMPERALSAPSNGGSPPGASNLITISALRI